MNLFENPEQQLTDIEKQMKIPEMISLFQVLGEGKKITGRQICEYFSNAGTALSQQRLCLWISYVRQMNYVAPYVLCGMQRGYCLTKDPELIRNQIESLEGRINSMRQVIDALRAQRQELIKRPVIAA